MLNQTDLRNVQNVKYVLVYNFVCFCQLGKQVQVLLFMNTSVMQNEFDPNIL